jgi:hypothetical protein
MDLCGLVFESREGLAVVSNEYLPSSHRMLNVQREKMNER